MMGAAGLGLPPSDRVNPGAQDRPLATLCRSWERPLAGWWVSDDAPDSMSAEDLRKVMRDLMDDLSGEIIRIEVMPEELTRTAIALSDYLPDAGAIRDTAVRKRVQATELRSRLAALQQEYAERFL